jgi:hypothetical protein
MAGRPDERFVRGWAIFGGFCCIVMRGIFIRTR